MANFGCEIISHPKGLYKRSLSLQSFLKSEYLISKIKLTTAFDVTAKDVDSLQIYHNINGVMTVSEYLDRKIACPYHFRHVRNWKDLLKPNKTKRSRTEVSFPG